jgi:hypothetical protein
MSFDSAWIACERSAAQLERALAEAFPDLEVVERLEKPSRADFARVDARVDGTRDQALMALAFYDDGTSGVCIDSSALMPMWTNGLAKLSELVGPTLFLYVARETGFAGFELFKEGESVRKVENGYGEDVGLDIEGEPIKQEEGIPPGRFSVPEANTLWAAFGMKRTPGEWQTGTCLVLYRDHECERSLDKRRPGWRTE